MSALGPQAVTAEGWGWRHAGRLAWAVRDVTLRIEPGERVLILGASGAGKSTLLHGIAGVLGDGEDGDAEGVIRIGDVPAAQARGRVGMILQDPDAQVILARVGDDVAFGCENLGVEREEIWLRVREALDIVGLDVPLDRSTSALSGGQKQRMAIAGVLAMRPGVIVLDEPTANLDPEGVVAVREAVARTLERHPATLIVVEHRVSAWLPLIDRVIVLGDGGVIADGTPADVFAREGGSLAARGVWVPGHPPADPPAPSGPPAEVLLQATDLAVGRVAGIAVASDIDLRVRAREALAITGPNGAGKSTLGLTIGGLIPPIHGTVAADPAFADGAPAAPIDWASKQLLTRIGSVFQEPEHQLLTKTVRAELEVGPRALKLPEAETTARVDELLERMHLTALAAANPYTLSGGQKRRLTVAAALATRPRMLILDEPTFGQDAVTWAELVAMLAAMRDDGASIVTITHDLDLVRALSAREIRMGEGPDGRAV